MLNFEPRTDETDGTRDRITDAEMLIMQLPNDHDGRNTWLLNYGTGIEAAALRARFGVLHNPATNAAELKDGEMLRIKGGKLCTISALRLRTQLGRGGLEVVK